jgi:maltose-binding protein MalE
MVLWAQGGRLVDEEGTLVVGRELLAALELWSDLANVARATQPMPVVWPQRELEDRFLAGELGMLIAGPRLARHLAMRRPRLDYAIAPLPEWHTQATRLSVDCLAISARSPHPELALRFLRHAGQDRFAKQMCSLGLLSASRSVGGNAGLRPFVTSLEHARTPPARLWPTVWPYLANVLVETLAGRMSAEAALRELLPTDVPSVLRLDESTAAAENEEPERPPGEP